ncbi:MAG: hypothetical protein A3H28_01660 [Acidobacteria bacterium RIFCSPLOWO2_02_FULL_61_28]|nr:MAG: hypothetical protein A3H28_01660 [Acidobacteria bacterium RIFCSPLOWO2_02_FULL_61_28]
MGLTILGAFARLIPHPPNFAPVGGMSLFAGSRLRGWQAYLVPVLLMVVTDPLRVALFHPGFPAFSSSTPFIYASLLINVWIGRRWLQTPNARRIAGAAFFGSLQFFLITNLAAFFWEASYPPTAAGLIACYVAAIPFYGRSLASDLFYSGLLFSLHAWTRRVASSKWVLATK